MFYSQLGELFDVVKKQHAEEALDFMRERKELPSLIIVDLNMPGMSGEEFLKHVRTSGFYFHIPVIILSGEDDSETRIRCLEAGADDFVIKPFNPRELGARSRNLIDRSSIQ